MALATAKRAVELVALLCVDTHFCWEGVNLRFVPSRLTRSDRPGHLTPPFYVRPWKGGLCVCPVGTVRLILKKRDRLHLHHGAVFFSWSFPEHPLDAAAFVRCIRYCLVKAGIQAAPGSTRSVAASAALAAAPPWVGYWGVGTGRTRQPISDSTTTFEVRVPLFGVDPLRLCIDTLLSVL
jgi:hypothetical protein